MTVSLSYKVNEAHTRAQQHGSPAGSRVCAIYPEIWPSPCDTTPLPHYAAAGAGETRKRASTRPSLVCNTQELWGRMRGRELLAWVPSAWHSRPGLVAVILVRSLGHRPATIVGQNAADHGPSDSTSFHHQQLQHQARMEQCSGPPPQLAGHTPHRVQPNHRQSSSRCVCCDIRGVGNGAYCCSAA